MEQQSLTSLSHSSKSIFDVPEILVQIFKNLNLTDLKSASLVNKSWRYYSWKELVSKSLIHFYYDDEDKMKDYLSYFSSRIKPNPQNLEITPHEHYKFTFEQPDDQLLTLFYQTFGKFMRSLDISGYVDVELDNQDQKTLTNLEHFSFAMNEVEFPIVPSLLLKGTNASLNVFLSSPVPENDTEYKYFGEFLARQKYVLSHLHFDDEHGLWYNESSLPLVKVIRGAKLQNFVSLNIPGVFDSETLKLLADGNIKCKKFSLSFNCKETSFPESFRLFLESQKDALEELYVDSTTTSRHEASTTLVIKNYSIPRMTQLRVLGIRNILIENFDFVASCNFPVLEKLRLTEFNWSSLELDANNTNYEFKKNENLKHCKIIFDYFKTETSQMITELLTNVIQAFPNLVSLSLTNGNAGTLKQCHVEQTKSSASVMKNLKKCNFTPTGIQHYEKDGPSDALMGKVKLRF